VCTPAPLAAHDIPSDVRIRMFVRPEGRSFTVAHSVTLLVLYQFKWPVFDAAFLALALRWAMVAVVLSAVAWIIFGVLARRAQPVRT
jgi:hypothetical protein